ncbi:MAG: Outer rane lipoprotein omlA precursor-like protein [Ramlibacter sp.]|jgi:outer membrane protein assembly factor BamE|uniref:outer membrane protein assembly factor BamE n=1 Tax=Ramlibacter sp. TaxID=1917967 RepID=UPI002623C206|nr:outer membrane protein assembly factor BamE [Ramlibacter sp.]MDB5749867.1 Outer rane lipoprotein omlA precursor-like protein [Ramlibacter sp.]
MPAKPLRLPRFFLIAAAAALLAGCGTFDSASSRMLGAITPYKVEVVQGNFISKEQVEALQPGMSREQVRTVLGTPLVTSLFHADRWDYVFSLKRQGVAPQQRRLTVYFSGEAMARFEGDTMPSEAEFVATLDRRKTGRIPVLEATEEQLRAAASKAPAAAGSAAIPAPAPAAPATPSPAVTYPPLEPPAR